MLETLMSNVNGLPRSCPQQISRRVLAVPIPFVSQLVRPFIIRLLTLPVSQDFRTPFYLGATSTFLHCPFSHFLKYPGDHAIRLP